MIGGPPCNILKELSYVLLTRLNAILPFAAIGTAILRLIISSVYAAVSHDLALRIGSAL